MPFLALILVVSLTGCSGGGGGGATPVMGGPAPPTPVNLGMAGDLKAAGSYVILTETSSTSRHPRLLVTLESARAPQMT